MTTMTDDLKPCPFCGHEGVSIHEDQDSKGNQAFFAECGRCSGRTGDEYPRAEAVAAWNRRASGWIAVEERLPEEGQVVIIWPRDEEHPAATFRSGLFDLVCCCQVAYDVTHWMPLPEPPKE